MTLFHISLCLFLHRTTREQTQLKSHKNEKQEQPLSQWINKCLAGKIIRADLFHFIGVQMQWI